MLLAHCTPPPPVFYIWACAPFEIEKSREPSWREMPRSVITPTIFQSVIECPSVLYHGREEGQWEIFMLLGISAPLGLVDSSGPSKSHLEWFIRGVTKDDWSPGDSSKWVGGALSPVPHQHLVTTGTDGHWSWHVCWHCIYMEFSLLRIAEKRDK